MIDCLFGALAKAVPEKGAADGCGGATLATFAGYRGGNAFVFNDILMGSWGGTAPHDGQERVPHMGANQSNVPIETIEIDFPLRIEHYGLVADSGGPGKHRGGMAIMREYRALEDDILLSVRSDKRAHPPLFATANAKPKPLILSDEVERNLGPNRSPEYLGLHADITYGGSASEQGRMRKRTGAIASGKAW